MRIEEYTKDRILADIADLQYLYQLKEVIRYNQNRDEVDKTESVAEHLYGMQLLSQYFLPLEDPDNKLDRARIYELITVHDFDEIVTGDYLSYVKTAEHKQVSEEGFAEVKKHIPGHIKDSVIGLLDEYEEQRTPEAKFTKAIDKIEPLVQIFNENGKLICHKNKCTVEDSIRIKIDHIRNYPFIKKFNNIFHEELVAGGYFWTGE